MWPPKLESLTTRQLALMELAEVAETVLQQAGTQELDQGGQAPDEATISERFYGASPERGASGRTDGQTPDRKLTR